MAFKKNDTVPVFPGSHGGLSYANLPPMDEIDFKFLGHGSVRTRPSRLAARVAGAVNTGFYFICVICVLIYLLILLPRRKRMGIEKTSIKVNRRLDPQSTLNPIFLHWIFFKY